MDVVDAVQQKTICIQFIHNKGLIKEHCSPQVGNSANNLSYVKKANSFETIDYTKLPFTFGKNTKM